MPGGVWRRVYLGCGVDSVLSVWGFWCFEGCLKNLWQWAEAKIGTLMTLIQRIFTDKFRKICVDPSHQRHQRSNWAYWKY